MATDQDVWLQFRSKLASELRRKDIKQYELAKMVGVAASSVTGWLKEGSLPHGPTLMRLARVLNLEPEQLVPGSGRVAHSGRGAHDPSAFLSGGREAFDQMEVALKEARARFEGRDESAKAARGSSDAVQQVERAEAVPPKARRSRGS